MNQFEVVDAQAAIDIRTTEKTFHACRTRCCTTKLHRVEINKIEDIVHVDIRERGSQRITVIVRAYARYENTLFASRDEKVVHLQVVLTVKNSRRVNGIERVADMYLRLIKVEQCQRLTFHVFPESDLRAQRAAQPLKGSMIVERDICRDMVVACRRL